MHQAAGATGAASAISHFITSDNPILVSIGVLGLISFGAVAVLFVILALRKDPEVG